MERKADENGSTAGGESTEYFFYDDNNVVMDACDADGSGTTSLPAPAHRYLWGQAVDELLSQENIRSDGSGGFTSSADDLYWTLQDRQQSVTDAINATGRVNIHNDFDAFGEQYQTLYRRYRHDCPVRSAALYLHLPRARAAFCRIIVLQRQMVRHGHGQIFKRRPRKLLRRRRKLVRLRRQQFNQSHRPHRPVQQSHIWRRIAECKFYNLGKSSRYFKLK